MRNQKGVVLIVSLIYLTIITLLAVTAIKTSNMEIKMAHAYQEGHTAFVEAENGLSMAGWELSNDFDTVLADYVANGDSYVDGSDDTAHSWYEYEMTYYNEAATGAGLEGFLVRSEGFTSTNAYRVVHQFFFRGIAAANVNAALSLHPAGSVLLKGNSTISGFDHNVPTDFDCNGVGCAGSPGSGPDVTGIYSETNVGDLTTIGSPTMEGAPATATGGGAHDQAYWLEYATNLATQATVHNGADGDGNVSWGTRDNPIIHVIDQNMLINGNLDGAGILILTGDGTNVTINGNFHFEGLIVAASPNAIDFTVGGTARIFGAVIAASPSVSIDVGASGTPGILFSQAALNNLANVSRVHRGGWAEERR